MFTGIVTDVGEIASLKPVAQGQLHRLRIKCRYDQSTIIDGASIACNGVCLTVVGSGVDAGHTWFEVDAAAETLRMTTARDWREGGRLNLERALKIGDELGGHIVSGHVDGVGEITAITPEGDSKRFTFKVPSGLARYIAPKGSVAIDGTSLTVNEVDGDSFGVNIIPHTQTVTTWGGARPGQRVHIEIDMLARYVARLTEFRPT